MEITSEKVPFKEILKDYPFFYKNEFWTKVDETQALCDNSQNDANIGKFSKFTPNCTVVIVIPTIDL